MNSSKRNLPKFYDHLSRYVLFTNFVKYGHCYASFTMHKTLWIPENERHKYTRTTRVHYINDFALKVADLPANPSVLDVGCGFGGTIYRWFKQVGGRYIGCNLSPFQIDIAKREAEKRGIDDRCQFYRKNYDEKIEGEFDAVVAIESLNYSENLSFTLKNLSRVLKPGGKIIIVDDILSDNTDEKQSDAVMLLNHWKLGYLTSESQYRQILKENHLQIRSEYDLTGQFQPGGSTSLRAVEKLCRLLNVLLPIPFIRSVLSAYLGGIALQKLYLGNHMKYLVWVVTFKDDG